MSTNATEIESKTETIKNRCYLSLRRIAIFWTTHNVVCSAWWMQAIRMSDTVVSAKCYARCCNDKTIAPESRNYTALPLTSDCCWYIVRLPWYRAGISLIRSPRAPSAEISQLVYPILYNNTERAHIAFRFCANKFLVLSNTAYKKTKGWKLTVRILFDSL